MAAQPGELGTKCRKAGCVEAPSLETGRMRLIALMVLRERKRKKRRDGFIPARCVKRIERNGRSYPMSESTWETFFLPKATFSFSPSRSMTMHGTLITW